MNVSFSNIFSLNGSNSTTLYILWTMIAFLVILIGGIGIAFFKQFRLLASKENKPISPSSKKPQGFY